VLGNIEKKWAMRGRRRPAEHNLGKRRGLNDKKGMDPLFSRKGRRITGGGESAELKNPYGGNWPIWQSTGKKDLH